MFVEHQGQVTELTGDLSDPKCWQGRITFQDGTEHVFTARSLARNGTYPDAMRVGLPVYCWFDGAFGIGVSVKPLSRDS